jgi:LysR family transcriptional activator of nhaA
MSDPHLNYHHLKLFWEVARAGSLRAAASRLQLSQPTISTQIKLLEIALGDSLFDRTGRGLRLTQQGRLVLEFSSKIFDLGAEMVSSVRDLGSSRSLRLNVGITDSIPKLVAWQLIRPAVKFFPNLQLACSEGSAQELIGLLASRKLDLILSDQAVPSSPPVKTFDHLIGKAPVIFCATSGMAKTLRKGFPTSLENAAALLPSSRSAWRHQIDRWFEEQSVRPRVIAEFDDAALMKTAAADGIGFVPIVSTALFEAEKRYGLLPIGRAAGCDFLCYLTTLDRATQHPALPILIDAANHAFRVDKGTIRRVAAK